MARKENQGEPPVAVPCPMCEGDCKLTYRVGSTRVWAARYRSKVVVCPVCSGTGFWLRGQYLNQKERN